MRVVFLDRDTFGPSVELIPPVCASDWVMHGKTSPDQVIERLSGADVAITNKVPIRAEHLDQLPDLKCISISATGYDCVDVAACAARGITVSNVRGYATETVPEHVFALILALRRSIFGYRQDVLDGEWQRQGQFCFFTHPIRNLSGSHIGIVGKGAIGQAVAQIAKGFGMQPVFAAHKGAADVPEGRVSFAEMLDTCDVITLHCPLTPATRHLIGAPEFSAMSRHPILINCGRGGLVDEAAAANAIEAGQIAGLGFDVTTTEPPSPDNPLLRVAHRPDVILTPHVAWAADEAMAEVWRQTTEAVDAWANGTPVRVLG